MASHLQELLLGPFLDPGSRTFWGACLTTALVAGIATLAGVRWYGLGALDALKHRSTGLDVQLYFGRQALFALLGGVLTLEGARWIATRTVIWADHTVGIPTWGPDWSPSVVTGLFAVSLFIAWDLSRFVVHLAMHRVPALWAFHQVHHSAEVLTPLTFHRIHPVESLIYRARGIVVTGLLTAAFFWVFRERAVDWELMGVHGLGLLFNLFTGNLRHSQLWLRFGPLERVFLSPAQHQLHHSTDPAHYDSNYGTWLACWDGLFGSLRLAGATPPPGFGVSDRNHGDTLLSAWFSPFRALLPTSTVAIALVLGGQARAQDAEAADDSEDTVEDEDGPDWDDFGTEVIVYSPDGTPRVAGSAHVISAETLEQFEYDNVEKAIAAVPGVATRSEDGFGLRPNISIRGVNSDRSAKVSLLEDGIPLVPAPYAAPAAYYFPMTTRLTGIEVFKGPAAITHGPNTIGGAINLLTRKVPVGTDGQADLAAGMRGTYKLHGWVGSGTERSGVLVEGTHLQTDGFKELDNGGPTGFDRTELMVKTRWSTDPAMTVRHGLELKLGYSNEVSDETYLGLTRADWEATPYRRYAATQNAQMRWNRTQAELSWPVDLGKQVKLRTTAYHHWMTRAWTKFNRFSGAVDGHNLLQTDPSSGVGAAYLAVLKGEADSQTDDQNLQIGTNDRRYHAFGVQSRMRWDVYGDKVSSTLRAGLRLHGDIVRRIHSEDEYAMVAGVLERTDDARVINLDSLAGAQALAAHAQEDLQIGRLHLLPGGRLEVIRTHRVDNDETPEGAITRVALLPGFGILGTVVDGLDLFAGVNRGFSPVAPGQPEEIRPELSWNYEAGARIGAGDGLHGELVGFFNDYQNITGACTVSGGCIGEQLDQQFNGGKAHVWGVEAVAGHQILLPRQLRLPIEATYTFTHGTFRTGFVSDFPQFGAVKAGDFLPYVPMHSGGGRISLAHPRVRFGIGANGHGGMRDIASNGPLQDTDVPAIFLLDAAIDGQVTKGLAVYVTGTNLTNSKAITSWRPQGARPTAPFQLMAGVKIGPSGAQ